MNKKMNGLKLLLAVSMGSVATMIPYNVLAEEHYLNILWNKDFVESGYESFNSVIHTNDGGFMTVGEVDVKGKESVSRGDAVIVNYDSSGNKKWHNVLEGEDTDVFYDVAQSSDGSFYAIGKSFSSDLGFTNDANISHAVIVKYDKEGSQEWIKAINDNGKQINYNSIVVTKSNKLAIAGEMQIDGKKTGFLKFTDINGNELSITSLNDDSRSTEINKVIETSENKFIVIGKSIDGDSSLPFISMIDKDGKVEWSYSPKSDSDKLVSELKGEFLSVVETKNGDLIVSGYASSEDDDALIMAFNKTGKRLWSHVDSSNKISYYSSVVIDSNDEILAIGQAKMPKDGDKLKDLNIVVDRYATDYSKKINSNNLSHSLNNAKPIDTIITTNNELVIVGERYNKVESAEATCNVTKDGNANECIQADAFITKVSIKEDAVEEDKCEIKELPEIKAEDITLNIGDKFEVLSGVSAVDKEGNNLTDKIEVTFNDVDVKKAGEYTVKYELKDDCGNVVEKIRKVTVKDKESAPTVDKENDKDNTNNKNPNTSKPQTGDITLMYAGLSIISSLGLIRINKKNK